MYKGIETKNVLEADLKSKRFKIAADEVLEVIQQWWNTECVRIEISDDCVLGYARSKATVKVKMQ